MLSKPLALGALVLAALVAVGTGAYLGVRQNDANLQSAAKVSPERLAGGEPADPRAVVEETETVIDESPVEIEPEPAAPVASAEPAPVVARAEPAPPAVAVSEPEPLPAEPVEPAPSVAVPAPTPEPVQAPVEAPVEAIDRGFEVEQIFEEDEIGGVASVEPISSPAPADDTNPWRALEAPWPSDDDNDDDAADAGTVVQQAPADTDSPWSNVADGAEPELWFEELVVAADSVIGLQIETRVSSEDARVEDSVDARVTRDVLVGDRVAVPAGTRLHGSVVLVERGGRMSKEARIGVRFHTLVMADSTELAIVTETIYREGEGQGGRSAKAIGGAAVTGAIIGAIFGGRRGAVLGGSVGAAGGTAGVITGDRNRTTLLPGMTFTMRLLQPVTVLVDW